MADLVTRQSALDWTRQRISGFNDRQLVLLTRWATGKEVMSDNERKELETALGTDTEGLHHFTNVWNAANRTGEAGWGNQALQAQQDMDYFGGSAAPGSKPKDGGEAAGRQSITEQIQKFVDSMTGASRPDDPVRMSLIQAGTDAAQKSAGAAGLAGRSTLAGTQAASVAQQNLAPYEAQRASMRGQGLNLLNQRDIGLGQLANSAMDLQNQAAAGKWAAQQNQNQGIGAAIGAGVGALGFIGGPALGAATMSAGSALGGGLGGLAGGGSGPSYSTPRYGGGSGSLGGSGGRSVNPYTGY